MKINQIKELIKETVFEMLSEDEDFQESVINFINENCSVKTNTNNNVPKEPADADLYDKLLLVAQGKLQEYKFDKKVVKAPNEGIGFKGKQKVLEWTNKAYTKIGGRWQEVGANDEYAAKQRMSDTTEFLSMFGGSDGGNAIMNAVAFNDDQALKRQLANSQMIMEDGSAYDMSEILFDTAKNTLPAQQIGASAALAGPALPRAPDPSEFGPAMKNWSFLAFQDEMPNK